MKRFDEMDEAEKRDLLSGIAIYCKEHTPPDALATVLIAPTKTSDTFTSMYASSIDGRQLARLFREAAVHADRDAGVEASPEKFTVAAISDAIAEFAAIEKACDVEIVFGTDDFDIKKVLQAALTVARTYAATKEAADELLRIDRMCYPSAQSDAIDKAAEKYRKAIA